SASWRSSSSTCKIRRSRWVELAASKLTVNCFSPCTHEAQSSLQMVVKISFLNSKRQRIALVPGASQSVQPGSCMSEIVHGGIVLLQILSHLPLLRQTSCRFSR
ncbi:unnamed protein product, partial [Ectocarpus sp. 4 AP-2014]